jgi:hypothetical protein
MFFAVTGRYLYKVISNNEVSKACDEKFDVLKREILKDSARFIPPFYVGKGEISLLIGNNT